MDETTGEEVPALQSTSLGARGSHIFTLVDGPREMAWRLQRSTTTDVERGEE